MDIATMGKRSILIPTPGQTEQEYLAKYLTVRKFALCIPQKEFDLQDALQKASRFAYDTMYDTNRSALSATINSFLRNLTTGQT
jgi:UDP-N-acetylglucosamine:LPS N-acetylglucosamine transferase